MWPYNTVNLGVTLLTIVGLLWLGNAWLPPARAVAVGFLVLGSMTLLSWRRAFGRARAEPLPPAAATPGGPELGG